MSKYIDREELIRDIISDMALFMGTPDDVQKHDEQCNRAILYIESATGADVVPVVHGRWIGAPLCGNDNCRCSACGSWHNIHANLRGEITQKYCPNCGAKMDGDGNADH